ncbi:MAG: MerC domain-containing protein [Hyphomonadaceae bacterium]|nr:MerC domain-containing protein [Hyphomonadaceae bacterium]
MAGRVSSAAALDASAITLSGLCLVHCLALPLMAAILPLAGVWAEAEWVHQLFVAVALPISGFAIWRSISLPGWKGFAALAVLGLALLIAAAFVEALHAFETPLTVAGAVLLASAHIWRWVNHRRCGPCEDN